MRVRLAVAFSVVVGLVVPSPGRSAPVSCPLYQTDYDLRTAYPLGLVATDLDSNVGKDLIVFPVATDGPYLLLNRGNGRFGDAIKLETGVQIQNPAVADYDGDGKTDVAFADFPSTGVTVLLNRGDGNFVPEPIADPGFPVAGLMQGDVDHDGDIDLVAVGWGSWNGSVLLNNGSGVFTVCAPFSLPPYFGLHYSILGDVNGDHYPDLIEASSTFRADMLLVQLNDGTGKFGAGVPIDTGHYFQYLVSADLDGDHDLDLVAVNGARTEMFVLKNKGDGTYSQPVSYSLRMYSWPVIGDCDGDSRPDISVIGEAGVGEIAVSVFHNLGGGDFETPQQFPVIPSANCLALGDFDADGDRDIAVGGWDGVYVLYNSRNRNFHPPFSTYAGSWANDAGYSRLTVGNFERDSPPEIACVVRGGPAAESEGYSLVLWRNYGDGILESSDVYPLGGNVSDLYTTDLNQDGDPDIVLLSMNPPGVISYTNGGDGTFTPHTPYTLPTTPTLGGRLYPGDFNNDGYPDFAVWDGNRRALSILMNSGDGSFLPPLDRPLNGSLGDLFPGDFNNDGYCDLAFAAQAPNSLTILESQGNGTFVDKIVTPLIVTPTKLTGGDFNGDGAVDLALTYSMSKDVCIYFGSGDGTFGLPVCFTDDGYPEALFSADLDGDGDPDLLVNDVQGTDPWKLYTNLGNGSFLPSQRLSILNYSFLLAADLDSDGNKELITTSYSQGIQVYWNLHSSECYCTYNRGWLFY